MIGVRFHDGTSVEYPEANYLHTDAAPAIQFVRKFQEHPEDQPTWDVIAELNAKDIKELYDDKGMKTLEAA